MDVAARHQGYSSNIYSPHYQVGRRAATLSAALLLIHCLRPGELPCAIKMSALSRLSHCVCVLHVSVILASVVSHDVNVFEKFRLSW